jgi:hypothetical protein
MNETFTCFSQSASDEGQYQLKHVKVLFALKIAALDGTYTSLNCFHLFLVVLSSMFGIL